MAETEVIASSRFPLYEVVSDTGPAFLSLIEAAIFLVREKGSSIGDRKIDIEGDFRQMSLEDIARIGATRFVTDVPAPRYEMLVNGTSELLTFHAAGRAYDSGFIPVDFGSFVIEVNGLQRPMTKDDRRRISDYADEYSGSK
jgi:hypothetical protein